MKEPVLRVLERVSGAALLLLGFGWLILGLHSLAGEYFASRGVFIIVVIAAALILGGALLAKPKASKVGRVLAILVCVLGAFRELMLLDHQVTMPLAAGSLIGVALLALYVIIVTVVIANYIADRRTAEPGRTSAMR